MKHLTRIFRDIEWWVFKRLLVRYCREHLDQFDAWKVNTRFGWVNVSIVRTSEEFNGCFVELK